MCGNSSSCRGKWRGDRLWGLYKSGASRKWIQIQLALITVLKGKGVGW